MVGLLIIDVPIRTILLPAYSLSPSPAVCLDVPIRPLLLPVGCAQLLNPRGPEVIWDGLNGFSLNRPLILPKPIVVAGCMCVER